MTYSALTIAKAVSKISGAGIVQSVFEHSCNLLIENQLIGIIPKAYGNNPYSITVSNLDFLSKIRNQMDVIVNENHILIGEHVHIKLNNAIIWNPNTVFLNGQHIVLFENLSVFLKNQKDLHFLLHLVFFESYAFVEDEYSQQMALKFTHFLKVFLNENHQPKLLLEAANDLVGLGSGLTPSGDDFLAGLVATLNAFGKTCEIKEVLMNALSTELTTIISQTLFKAALNGWFSERVNVFLYALITSHNAEQTDIQTKWRAVQSIGHSSGTDTIAGIYVALKYLKFYGYSY
jgi:hypothetical protein